MSGVHLTKVTQQKFTMADGALARLNEKTALAGGSKIGRMELRRWI